MKIWYIIIVLAIGTYGVFKGSTGDTYYQYYVF